MLNRIHLILPLIGISLWPLLAGQVQALDPKRDSGEGLIYYGTSWVKPADIEAERNKDRRKLGWDFTSKIKTAHYEIWSGRPEALMLEVSEILENEVDAYRNLYGTTWELNENFKPIKVFLFADRDSFAQVALRVRGGPIVDLNNGFYGRREGAIYLGMAKNAASYPEELRLSLLLHTARHETSHALDDLFAGGDGRLPAWVSEGLAEHLAYAAQGRQTLPGVIRVHPNSSGCENVVLEASKASLVDLFDARKLQAGSARLYGLSWAFVHFLFHAEQGRYAKGFSAYLRDINERRSLEDLEICLGRKLSDLEPEFKLWIKQELYPAVKKSS